MLTIQQLATSKNITMPVLNSWIYRYGLPVIRIGRRNYIDEEDYNAWVKAHRQVLAEQPRERSLEVALPKQCRKSSIASKIKRVY